MVNQNGRLSVWQNPRTSLKLSVSYEKDTTEDSEAKELIKSYQPNQTKPREIHYLKQHIDRK